MYRIDFINKVQNRIHTEVVSLAVADRRSFIEQLKSELFRVPQDIVDFLVNSIEGATTTKKVVLEYVGVTITVIIVLEYLDTNITVELVAKPITAIPVGIFEELNTIDPFTLKYVNLGNTLITSMYMVRGVSEILTQETLDKLCLKDRVFIRCEKDALIWKEIDLETAKLIPISKLIENSAVWSPFIPKVLLVK